MADPVLNGKYPIELDELVSIELNAWLVFQPDEVSDEAFRISLTNFITALPASTAVADEYDTIADLIAAQSGQVADSLYRVINPIADPAFNDLPDTEVKSVYYHLPGAKTSSLSDYNSIAFPKLGSNKNAKLGNSLDAFTFDIKFRTAEWSSNQATLQAVSNALDLNSPQDLKLTGESIKLITGNDPTEISRVLFGLDGQLIFEPIEASKIQSDSDSGDVTLNDSYQEILSITGNQNIGLALANIGLTAKSFTTGSITAFADASDGRITATSATHGLSEGDFVEIVNTSNYDGIYEIKSVPNINDFDITKAFVATETGDWEKSADREIAIDLRINEISVKEFTRQIEGEGRLNFSEQLSGLVDAEDIDVFAKSNTAGEAIEIFGTTQSTQLKVINSDVGSDLELNTWYVNTGGSDGNIGSPQSPFLTPQAAIDSATSGDVIHFGKGSFSGNMSISKNLTFIGVGGFRSMVDVTTWLGGTITIDSTSATKTIRFKNLIIQSSNDFVKTGSNNIFIALEHCRYDAGDFEADYVYLLDSDFDSENGIITINNALTAYDSDLSENSLDAINIGSETSNIRQCTIKGDIIGTGNLILRNSETSSDISVTGTFTQNNSVVLGTITAGTHVVNNQLSKQEIAATLSIPFNKLITKIDPLTITGATEFTVNTTDAEYGNVTYIRVTADGTNIPTFTSLFQKLLSSLSYDNTAGIVNIISFWYDGVSYLYSINQPEASAPPTVVSMTVEDDERNDLVVVFDEIVTATNIGYTFRVDAAGRTLNSVSGSGTNTLTFVISGAGILDSDVLDLAYDSGTGDTLNAGLTELETFTATSVTNNTDTTAPTLTTLTIEDASDDVVDCVFNEAVNITTAGWNIDTDGAALSISSILSGSGTTTPKIQLSRSILSTETLNMDYDSGTGNTTDTASTPNELVSITDRSVTNNVASGYEAESTALFARMATAGDEPDATRKGHINTLIAGMKTDGEWAELDAIHVYAAHAESVSKLNWTEDDHNGSLVSVPSFTTDRGYTFDGIDDAIDTDFIPSVDAVNVGQDDITIWAYIRTAPSNISIRNLFGANQNSTASTTAIQLYQNTSTNILAWRVNHHTTFIDYPETDGIFNANTLYAILRTASNAQALNVDGSNVDTDTTASVGLPNVSMYVGANHLESTGSGSAFLDPEIMAWGIGSSSINLTDLKTRLDTFLTALGAI